MNLQTHSNAQSSHSELRNPNNGDESHSFFEDFESACSTPYVSAPSSPGRGSSGAGGGGFFYSAPASPIHFSLTSSSFIANSSSSSDDNSVPMGYEFEFSARFGSAGPVQPGSMSSADELFLNGKIRPMKLSTHLERPQVLAPLLDLDHEEGEEDGVGARGRDLRFRDKSLRRRTRSMSPMRREWTEAETEIEAQNDDEEEKECGRIGIEEKRNNGDVYDDDDDENDTKLATNASSASAPSSRSSSAGRNSKRWMFLKEFLRSKSEGRSNHKYFWSNISSAAKDKKSSSPPPLPPQNSGNASTSTSTSSSDNISANVNDVGGGVSSPMNEGKKGGGPRKKAVAGTGARVKPANGVVEKSKNKKKKKTYELHYTANRAQAEEMRKKTYLPYRQGLLGCLGFSSKGYGAVNGLARALNPVSSR